MSAMIILTALGDKNYFKKDVSDYTRWKIWPDRIFYKKWQILNQKNSLKF